MVEGTVEKLKELLKGPRLTLDIESELFSLHCLHCWGFPSGRVVENLPANTGDAAVTVSIPGLGRSPEGGNGNPLQYPYQDNPTDRGAWWAIVYGVTKSRT